MIKKNSVKRWLMWAIIGTPVAAIALVLLFIVLIITGRNRKDIVVENLVVDVFATMSGARRQMHPVKDVKVPKVLKITTNINEVVPGISLVIERDFMSLSEPWYCQCYGGGAGTMRWHIEDTIAIVNKNGPIIVPLYLEGKTFCPYLVEMIYVAVGSHYRTNSYWLNQNEILIFRDTTANAPLPRQIEFSIVKTTDSCKIIGEELRTFSLPENGTDTIALILHFYGVE